MAVPSISPTTPSFRPEATLLYRPSPMRSPVPLILLAALIGAHASPPPDQMERGAALFGAKCALCHQITGTGVPPVYPPLARSDWMMGDRVRTAKVLCEGLEGPITVNGQKFSNVMPAQV